MFLYIYQAWYIELSMNWEIASRTSYEMDRPRTWRPELEMEWYGLKGMASEIANKWDRSRKCRQN